MPPGSADVSAEAWLNGRIVPRGAADPSVASSTFHMGSGVFDGLMAYWNEDHWHLHLACEHLLRFCAGCERMGLAHGWSAAQLEAGARELLARCPAMTRYLRPIAFRPQPEILLAPSRELPVSVCLFAVAAERDRDGGLTAGVSPVRRVSSEAIPVAWKICGAYANSFIAQTQALEDGFDTAIFLDRSGRVCEASVANLFFIAGESLVTPDLGADVFPGLTRELVLRLARERGVATSVRDVAPAELASFDGAFACSTLMEIRPLARIDAISLRTESLPLFRRIRAWFRDLTHERAPYPAAMPEPPLAEPASPRTVSSSRWA
ncbi:MAG: aminotransferase class IV [Solirubrobacterales bacterium]